MSWEECWSRKLFLNACQTKQNKTKPFANQGQEECHKIDRFFHSQLSIKMRVVIIRWSRDVFCRLNLAHSTLSFYCITSPSAGVLCFVLEQRLQSKALRKTIIFMFRSFAKYKTRPVLKFSKVLSSFVVRYFFFLANLKFLSCQYC